MSERLGGLMEAANLLTAGHLAQEPHAFRPGIDLAVTLEEARDQGFTRIFVEDDGGIQRWLGTAQLRDAPTWGRS